VEFFSQNKNSNNFLLFYLYDRNTKKIFSVIVPTVKNIGIFKEKC